LILCSTGDDELALLPPVALRSDDPAGVDGRLDVPDRKTVLIRFVFRVPREFILAEGNLSSEISNSRSHTCPQDLLRSISKKPSSLALSQAHGFSSSRAQPIPTVSSDFTLLN